MSSQNQPTICPSDHASVKQYPAVTTDMLITLRYDRRYGSLRYRRLFAYFLSNRIKVIQPILIFFLCEGLGLRFVLGEADWARVHSLNDLLMTNVSVSNNLFPMWQLLILVQLICFAIIVLTSLDLLIMWLRLTRVARKITNCRAIPVKLKFEGDQDSFKVFEIDTEETNISYLSKVKKIAFSSAMIEGDRDRLREEFPSNEWIEGSMLATDSNTAYAFVTDRTALWIPAWHATDRAMTEIRLYGAAPPA